MTYSGQLTDAFVEMMKPPVVSNEPIIQTSPDGKYRAKILGAKMDLFIVKPDGEQFLKTKTCTDSNHAENTVKKFWRQPQALADFVTGVND